MDLSTYEKNHISLRALMIKTIELRRNFIKIKIFPYLSVWVLGKKSLESFQIRKAESFLRDSENALQLVRFILITNTNTVLIKGQLYYMLRP